MFKWLFHILIFATSSGKYQNKEKPLKHQKKFGLDNVMMLFSGPQIRGGPIKLTTKAFVAVFVL